MLSVAILLYSTLFTITLAEDCNDLGYTIRKDVIGKGNQAEIVSGFRRSDNLELAIKKYAINPDEFEYKQEEHIFKTIQKYQSEMTPGSTSHLPLIHSFCSVDELPAIVMEKLDFHLMIPEDLAEKFRLVQQILMAVSELHRMDIAHLDIKQENFMLTAERGTVKLIDFGLSVTVQTASSFRGAIVGTLPFIAPERLSGDPSESYDVFKEDSWSTATAIFRLLADEDLHPYEVINNDTDYLEKMLVCVEDRIKIADSKVERQNNCDMRGIYYYYLCVKGSVHGAEDPEPEPLRATKFAHIGDKCPSCVACAKTVFGNENDKDAFDNVRRKWHQLMQKLVADYGENVATIIGDMLRRMFHIDNKQRDLVSEASKSVLTEEVPAQIQRHLLSEASKSVLTEEVPAQRHFVRRVANRIGKFFGCTG